MNAYANHVVSYLLAQSWQVAVLAGIVGLISFALRNRNAHVRYLLWLIVLAKCLVPPFLTLPLAVLPESYPNPSVAAVGLPEEHFAPEPLVSVVGTAEPQALKPALPSACELAVLAWMAGVLLFLLWVGGRAVGYTAWLRDRRRPLPPALRETIRELCAGFRFRRWPKIWLVQDISQPFVWGLLRGNVYLPADFVRLGGSDQQRSILAHELSHIARYDAGVNLLQVPAQSLYWFHPLVWWSNRKIRQEREKCCDEMAIAHLNTQPDQYTGAIVDALAAERRSAHPIPSLAIVGSVRDIEERIKTMLKPGRTFRTRPTLVAASVASLIALITIPTTLVLTAKGQAQPTAQSANQPAASSEKPEAPRYAARTFNSKVVLDVLVQTTNIYPPRRVGRTSATPLEIPACYAWYVRPSTPGKDWDLLVREINQNKVPGLALRSATDSDLQRLGDLTELQHLDLSLSPQVTDAGLKSLKGLTGLQDLYLMRTQITDAGLAHLKDLAGLKVLYLRSTQITGTGLEHLKGLTGLQRLYLYDAQITDAGLQHIRDLTGLQDLNLTGTHITDVGLAHLKGLTGMQILWLGNTKVTDAGLEHLKDLTALQELDLAGTQITDAGLRHIRGLIGLQDLNLTRTHITDVGVEHLKSLTRLDHLALANTSVTDTGLEHLKGLTRLRALVLGGTQITDAGLEHISGLTGLQELYLYDARITDAGLEHLKGLTGLQYLELAGTQITGVGLEHLKALSTLSDLILADTRITDAGLEHVKDLAGLQYLNLAGTQISDAGLEHIKGLTGLQSLRLDRTQVTDAGVQQLKQALPDLTIVRRGPRQTTTESADRARPSPNKPAADSEKPEQSRFAARTFNSKVAFEVWVQETSQSEGRQVGRTPSATPVEIPACWGWQLRPVPGVPVENWDLLIRELSQNSVPGLWLDGATASDLTDLASVTTLRRLYMHWARVTDAGLEHLKGLTTMG